MEKKNSCFDSLASSRTVRSSGDFSIDFGDVLLMQGPSHRDHLQSIPCQYFFGLEMRIEDFRSHYIERPGLEPTDWKLLKFQEDHRENQDETCEIVGQKAEIAENFSEFQEIIDARSDNLKIKELEKVIGYFFNSFDTIQYMETRFKEEIDSDYICGRYFDLFKEIFCSHETKIIEKSKQDLEDLKKELIEKKEKLKKIKKDYEKKYQELTNMIKSSNERIFQIKKDQEFLFLQKLELEQAIQKFNEEKSEIIKRKSSLDSENTTPKSCSSEKSPRFTGTETFKSLIDDIKEALEFQSAPEAAASIIDKLKTQVKEINEFKKTDKVDLLCLKNNLEARIRTFERYEVIRKNELLLAQRALDTEIAKVKKCVDGRKMLKEMEMLSYIRAKQKDLKSTEEEVKLILNTIYSLQSEILNSIENFKGVLAELYNQNREMNKNIKLLRMFAVNVN
jgi:DNA repair exonuclease SbcCD ATPase subunit